MSKNKKKKKVSAVEKHNQNVINELLGEVENESDIEIESDVANLGMEQGGDLVDPVAEKYEKKRRFFFGVAVFVIVMALIGLYSSIRFIAKGISELADNKQLKTEFARFLVPVVANDIVPFENESEISNLSKVSCSIWNILVNKDTSGYKPSPSGGIYIPEYDIVVSCKEIFGPNSSVTHQTVGSGDSKFVYDEENHVYRCVKDLRYLNYAPKITAMKKDGNDYILTVDYLPPSITMTVEELGITVNADKTLEYTITRDDKRNTLKSVRIINSEMGE